MKHSPRVLLRHAELAGTDIGQILEGKSRQAYVDDRPAQLAVERCFITIGEALNRLHRSSPELAGKIPNLRRIVDFRNLLVHGYENVDDEAVWDIAANALPKLLETIRELLAELNRKEEGKLANDDDSPDPFAVPDPFKPPSPFD